MLKHRTCSFSPSFKVVTNLESYHHALSSNFIMNSLNTSRFLVAAQNFPETINLLTDSCRALWVLNLEPSPVSPSCKCTPRFKRTSAMPAAVAPFPHPSIRLWKTKCLRLKTSGFSCWLVVLVEWKSHVTCNELFTIPHHSVPFPREKHFHEKLYPRNWVHAKMHHTLKSFHTRKRGRPTSITSHHRTAPCRRRRTLAAAASGRVEPFFRSKSSETRPARTTGTADGQT